MRQRQTVRWTWICPVLRVAGVWVRCAAGFSSACLSSSHDGGAVVRLCGVTSAAVCVLGCDSELFVCRRHGGAEAAWPSVPWRFVFVRLTRRVGAAAFEWACAWCSWPPCEKRGEVRPVSRPTDAGDGVAAAAVEGLTGSFRRRGPLGVCCRVAAKPAVVVSAACYSGCAFGFSSSSLLVCLSAPELRRGALRG
ncbi:hypothetical protein TraAM80_09445 [Trypanosoma rangeli]|uniref:Uncharacterized protein n=1 Tax=Trypanosoma rangeli TaxID=5698 RepID=A0A3R7MYF6_TRYRA|nr:uncharacterized protein TraAM80_09445 [Trypanosoma rangeli]RNE97216.1 hypothetical protein TraAM80_09445 [Trypanosoma rangeli]|eukprot:RNE97216.1 hypothetical protein TraAM80_09445 [Trypanosoma rangeli]